LLIKLTEELNSKKTIYDAYIKGESERVEFKPSLINWSKSIRNIELEIAKTLCGFSNSNGGLLYIGFSDSGQVLGIDFKYISKDKFKREFTRIKTYYLPQSIAHTIYGDFYVIDSKEIFVITVYPYSEPVFLKTKDEKDRFIKEFYVRSDAATRQIYDIEEMYKYCINKWHKKYE
jgi:predicted HTH transcriptional regulator